MKTRTTSYLEITDANYVSGYKIRLTFNDGVTRVVNFEPFLRKAMNPDITKYRQFRNFKNFHLHYGDLMWGDFEMIFPISDLHHGNILKGEETAPGLFLLRESEVPAKGMSEKKRKLPSALSYKRTKTHNRRKN